KGASGKGRKKKAEEDDEEDFSGELDQLNDPGSWSDISNENVENSVENSVASRIRDHRRPSSSLPKTQYLPGELEDGEGLHAYHSDSDDSTKDPDWTNPVDHCAKQQSHTSFTTGRAPSLITPALKPSRQSGGPDFEGDDINHYQDQVWPFDPTDGSPISLEWGVDSLFHPDILNVTVEQESGFNDHWSAFTNHGASAQQIGAHQRSLPLSQAGRARTSVQLPAGIDLAMCLSHIWHVFQVPDVTKPPSKALLMSNTTLDGINPEHHVRMVVADVLNIECALPSVKFIESTLATTPNAFNAILRHLENILSAYTDHIISSSEIIQYGDLNLLPMLRLATIVNSSGFIRDQGKFGHYCSTVQDMTDRLLESWAAISLVRYFGEVLGRSVDIWWRKTSNHSRLGDLWLRFDVMWKRGINSLVGSLRAGRTDLFKLTLFSPSSSEPLERFVESILSQAAWWTPTDKTLPVLPSIRGKLSIHDSETFSLLLSVDWAKATFIDRAVAMLLLMAGAVQISSGRVRDTQNSDLLHSDRLLDVVCKISSKIDDCNLEDGPLAPTTIDRSSFIAEVAEWVTVWQREEKGAPGTGLFQELQAVSLDKPTPHPNSPPAKTFQDASGATVIHWPTPLRHDAKQEQPSAEIPLVLPALEPNAGVSDSSSNAKPSSSGVAMHLDQENAGSNEKKRALSPEPSGVHIDRVLRASDEAKGLEVRLQESPLIPDATGVEQGDPSPKKKRKTSGKVQDTESVHSLPQRALRSRLAPSAPQDKAPTVPEQQDQLTTSKDPEIVQGG
ncbi:hypothetical protein M407DRAFT_210632, partial [Tulasnella calospora MUT 4182]